MAQRDASDPKEVKDAKKRERLLRERERNDLRVVLASREGRRFLWRVLSESKVGHNAFVAEDEGGRETAFRLGRQSFGQWLFAEILDTNEEAYLLMRKEQKEDMNG